MLPLRRPRERRGRTRAYLLMPSAILGAKLNGVFTDDVPYGDQLRTASTGGSSWRPRVLYDARFFTSWPLGPLWVSRRRDDGEIKSPAAAAASGTAATGAPGALARFCRLRAVVGIASAVGLQNGT